MEYIKVDNKQIAEVGFGEGFYGPETLGIIFTPNRKQAAGRVPGNEYHYDGVTARVHRAMTAADDVYVYFSENIKKHPEAFPYVKIEAVPKAPVYASQEPGMFDDPRSEGWVADPTEPRRTTQATVTGTTQDSSGTTKTMPTQLPASETSDTPSTALAVIDTMADDLLFTPGAVTDAQLAAGRKWYLTEAKKYDITTEKSRTELKRFARPLQKLRTGIEARAKELTGATKRKIAAIDAEKRRLVMLVGGIEQEVLALLTNYEAAEAQRISFRNAAIDEIENAGPFTQANWLNLSTEVMRDRVRELQSDTRDWPELGNRVEVARKESIRLITEAIAKREAYDAEQAELAKLRAEAAARAEQDRITAAVEAAKLTIREEVIAELTPVRSILIPVDKVAELAADAPKVSFDIGDQRIKVIEEITESFIGYVGVQDVEVNDIRGLVEAIANGLIPHVTITY